MSISQLIIDFLHKSVLMGDIDPLDVTYFQNKLLKLMGANTLKVTPPSRDLESRDRLDLLDQLLDYGVDQALIDDNPSERDLLGSAIMDLITPVPSQVNDVFWTLHQDQPESATEYFYDLSRRNNYIKTRETAQNITFDHDTEFGRLQLTINLSKPEKTSKEIEQAKNDQSDYPVNQLVDQNEGYYGRIGYPGRSNHRIIRLELDGADQWGFQYSPYAYYNEHSIFLAMQHRPMDVGLQAIKNLLNILEIFPHYFVGSNAGLPIVGGSILSHDHYQGGRHSFPLDSAKSFYDFKIAGVEASLVEWPMSVIRLKDKDRQKLAQAASHVLEAWHSYSNETIDIRSHTGKTPHNAITPLSRKDGEDFVLDLVLRNNRTNDQYPDGIFHPHPNVQHIKKENIGLIEVLGLAVLPPRLKPELKEVKDYLLGKTNQVAPVHQDWVDRLSESGQEFTEETIDQVIEAEVGQIFLQVLKDAGVFKLDEQGRQAFINFADQINND